MSKKYEAGRMAGAIEERARLLAYLASKHRAQAAVAQQYARAELNELAEDRRRQLEVMIEEIEAGMHCEAADAGKGAN